jgi:hypothetical protein
VRFQEGAIPTAIHLPFIGFDKFADRLPKDKDSLSCSSAAASPAR